MQTPNNPFASWWAQKQLPAPKVRVISYIVCSDADGNELARYPVWSDGRIGSGKRIDEPECEVRA